jgi:hypothetical protein
VGVAVGGGVEDVRKTLTSVTLFQVPTVLPWPT